MSRMALPLIAAGLAMPGMAQSQTAEQAISTYQQVFKPTKILDCPQGDNPDEIVVCARKKEVDPNRLPLPVQRVEGERIAGDARATTAVGGCLRLCHQPVQVDLIRAVPKVIEGVKKILNPDE